jgi:hypothetical protein
MNPVRMTYPPFVKRLQWYRLRERSGSFPRVAPCCPSITATRSFPIRNCEVRIPRLLTSPTLFATLHATPPSGEPLVHSLFRVAHLDPLPPGPSGRWSGLSSTPGRPTTCRLTTTCCRCNAVPNRIERYMGIHNLANTRVLEGHISPSLEIHCGTGRTDDAGIHCPA